MLGLGLDPLDPLETSLFIHIQFISEWFTLIYVPQNHQAYHQHDLYTSRNYVMLSQIHEIIGLLNTNCGLMLGYY